MIKNYLTIALRSLNKHRFYSTINILGFSVGLTSFLLISLYVIDELSYDQFHPDAERMYRVDFSATLNGADVVTSNVGAPTGPALVEDYPEVESATRLNTTGTWFIRQKNGTETFKEKQVLMADSNFFEFFSLPLKYGQAKTALNRPNMVAMDAATSLRIFGDRDPIGEVVVLDNEHDYEVGAVYYDLPKNAHFQHNMLLSMATFDWVNRSHWLSTNFNTYIKLEAGRDPYELEQKFPAMIEKYCGPLIAQFFNMNLQEFQEMGNAINYALLPVTDIHLRSQKEGELSANSDIKYVYIFSAVAGFILLLACINFMNLATARSASRAKEVGVRKAMGALKGQLIGQFLAEAIVISCLSFVLAFALSVILLPSFNVLSGKSLTLLALFDWQFIVPMTFVLFVSALLAGSYPAFYLSSFRPVQVLKGKFVGGRSGRTIRSVLVVLQFGISIIMIISTGIVSDQLTFIQQKNVGFNREQVLMVEDTWLLGEKAKAFKNESSRYSSIISSCLTAFTPTNHFGNSDLYFKQPDVSSDQSLVINEAFVGHSFFETLEMELVEGRSFSRDMLTDSTAVILNETAVRRFGYENPLEDKIYTYQGGSDGETVVAPFRIVGVVKDFHFQSMRQAIEPLVFHLDKNASSRLLYKVDMAHIDETIGHLNSTWESFAPGQPFAFKFLDDQFNALYESEARIGSIFQVFAFLSVFIACLGLFGLASFTAEQRTKEIGIRKVLGATIPGIIGLLSKDFLRLIIIAIVIAAPVAYFFMNEWLTDFEYRTALKPITFLGAGVVAFIVSWLAMGAQSYKAARANPAKSLKDE